MGGRVGEAQGGASGLRGRPGGPGRDDDVRDRHRLFKGARDGGGQAEGAAVDEEGLRSGHKLLLRLRGDGAALEGQRALPACLRQMHRSLDKGVRQRRQMGRVQDTGHIQDRGRACHASPRGHLLSRAREGEGRRKGGGVVREGPGPRAQALRDIPEEDIGAASGRPPASRGRGPSTNPSSLHPPGPPQGHSQLSNWLSNRSR